MLSIGFGPPGDWYTSRQSKGGKAREKEIGHH